MNRKSLLRVAAVGLTLTLTVGASATLLTGCKTSLNNEKTPFVLSTDLPDGVFNPFFYTAGADGDIVGQTQIAMLSSDVDGLLTAGKDEPCVAQAFGIETTDNNRQQNIATGDYDGYYTDYYFAIKDDIVFSDGEPLTIKDVLFNVYMYLDPAYSGSSTMYSVDIQGLGAYRAQSADLDEQKNFNSFFSSEALARTGEILAWIEDDNSTWSDDSFSIFENSVPGGIYGVPEQGVHIKSDILKAHDYFKQELKNDLNAFQDEDARKDYEKYGFKTAWEVFMYEYGFITVITDKDASGKTKYKVDYQGIDKWKTHKDDEVINYVYEGMLGDYATAPQAYKNNLYAVINYYQTASDLRQYFVSQAISDYYKGELSVTSVKGITVEKRSSMPITEYYKDASGSTVLSKPEVKAIDPDNPAKEFDVLKIRINKIDPKAIQNFGFTVAPAHYYASKYEIDDGNGGKTTPWDKLNKQDLNNINYFGVEFGDFEYMETVRTNHVPLGAGAYRVTKRKGTKPTDTVNKDDFFANGTLVYMERNDNFLLGPAKIKYLRYQYVGTSKVYEATKKQIHFSTPTANDELVNGKLYNDRNALDYVMTDNLGYGYIGVNASFVPEIQIRQAIMHAMNTNLCAQYYGGDDYCTLINRPMSTTLKDYYPTNATSKYPYDSTGEKSLDLAHNAGYTELNGNNKLYNPKTKKTLKYTFTIAGESMDHPAYNVMNNAKDLLNSIGFDISLVTSSRALSQLANGQLAVWAAAWSSSSDPDMYQVYHKDSSATSIKAWGYPYLLGTKGTVDEKDIIKELSDKIEMGRETNVISERRDIYWKALDLVMDLAVELPTYQRKNIYVFRRNFFDEYTRNVLFAENNISAYQSPLSKIWEVGFNEG